jgi:hypothetical protein
MNDRSRSAGRLRPTRSAWARLAVLLLVVAAIGVPVNHLFGYALLLIATVLIFSGEVMLGARRWLAALAAVAFAALLPLAVAPAPIAQGVNIFLPGKPGNVFERGLPPDVYRFMTTEFDALYPPAVRCAPTKWGCWIADGLPSRLYAFAADGVFQHPAYSRNVRTIDFSDPVWLRLGFINDVRYNWATDAPDVHRGDRNKPFWAGLHRWRVTMPWFVMNRFPADYVGGKLCWRGTLLWPGADGHYRTIRHATEACRSIGAADVGGKIFGVAIRPGSLAMKLQPPAFIQARLAAGASAALLAVIAVLLLLIRVHPRDTLRPFVLIGLSLLVIAVMDASFIGGWRPMDGGDDGLFYTGVGRHILEHLLGGNIAAALIGGEKVFYYGGPGLRYLRAAEMIVFGDTNLGYLSLVLLMPMLMLRLFQRFLPDRLAWALALVFTAVPVGEIFGTCFVDYAKWAARGFADPASYILFIAGLLVLLGKAGEGPRDKLAAAFFSALLIALALWVRPVIALATAVILGGAGLAALHGRQWRRLAGMCIGFLPAFGMALHNYVFGGVFVLFSSNTTTSAHTPMPPWDYIGAAKELLALDFHGAHIDQAVVQIVHWLSGPSELAATIPLNLAAVAVVVYVLAAKGRFDPWLRLIALAALAQHLPALFYAPSPRYYFLAWLLTALVCLVWAREIGLPLLLRRYPHLAQPATGRPFAGPLATGLSWLQKITA